MATITIQRTNEYYNRLRNYKIFIDGEPVGTMANGETKDFVIGAGQHTIKAKIDWCGSPEVVVNVDDGKAVVLKVSGFKNASWIMPVVGGIIAVHFALKAALNIDYTIFLIIPAFLLLLYYLTIGRKKYLRLSEMQGK